MTAPAPTGPEAHEAPWPRGPFVVRVGWSGEPERGVRTEYRHDGTVSGDGASMTSVSDFCRPETGSRPVSRQPAVEISSVDGYVTVCEGVR